MEQTSTPPVRPAAPRRPGPDARPAEAHGAGALHPLEARRIAAGFNTAGELADAAGLSRNSVANLEDGTVARARVSTARALATALNVPLFVLLDELHRPAGGIDPDHPQAVVVAVRYAKKQRVRYLGVDPKATFDVARVDGEASGDLGVVVDGPKFSRGLHLYEVAWDGGDTTWTPASFIEAIA